MLFPERTDDFFLSTCKEKRNYGQNVETYRISAKSGQFSFVDKDKAMSIPESVLERIMVSSERLSSRQATKKGMKRIFKTTIKTKGYLLKLLSSLPLPLAFSTVLLFAFLCAMIVSVAGVVEYIVSDSLFAKVHNQMSLIKVQTESISTLSQISTMILDVVGYNKYSLHNL